jgi:hypothetical protein
MAVRLSALRAGGALPQRNILVLISVRGWVYPWDVVRLEGLGKLRMSNNRIGNRVLPRTYCYERTAGLPRFVSHDNPLVPPRVMTSLAGCQLLSCNGNMLNNNITIGNVLCCEVRLYRPMHVCTIWDGAIVGSWVHSVGFFSKVWHVAVTFDYGVSPSEGQWPMNSVHPVACLWFPSGLINRCLRVPCLHCRARPPIALIQISSHGQSARRE